jgi:co-chaperonin GroES (HSP10)
LPAGYLDVSQTLTPIKNRILVRQDPSLSKVGKEGILFAPQGHETWPTVGTIVALGPQVEHPEDLAPGTRVLFKRRPKGSGCGALVPDAREGGPDELKDLVVLREDDILGLVEA